LEGYVGIVEAAAGIGADDEDDEDDSCEGELLEVMPAVVQFVVDVYRSSVESRNQQSTASGRRNTFAIPTGWGWAVADL
jgi:hypothetical protein